MTAMAFWLDDLLMGFALVLQLPSDAGPFDTHMKYRCQL